MTENTNEPWHPKKPMPSFLETPETKENEPAPRLEKPAFPGEMPSRPPADAPSAPGLPPGLELPSSLSGATRLPAEAVAQEYPYETPPRSEKTYDEILREAQARPTENPAFYPPAASNQAPQPNQSNPLPPSLEKPAFSSSGYEAPLTPMPGQGFPGGPPPSNQYMQNQEQPQPTNVLAIVALILGILCMGIIAIPLAVVALFQIKSSNQKGKGLAISAIVISLIEIIMSIVGAFAIYSLTLDAIDQCESGNPDPAYVDFCDGYNSSNNNNTTDPFSNDTGF